MDFHSIFRSYCVELGIDPPEESSQCHVLRIDDLDLTIAALTQGVAIGSRIAQLSMVPRDCIEQLLATSLFVMDAPSRACPLNFATDSATDSLMMVGARDRIDDLEDFKAMIDHYLSLRSKLVSIAKERGIEGFEDG